MKYLRRGSGYYIDVGASELVANGSIKLKKRRRCQKAHGTFRHLDRQDRAAGRSRRLRHWLRFDERLRRDLISREVADKVGKVWGLGSNTTKDPGPWEGEQRNMWKPTQQEGLWFHGGNLHQSRHYSQFLSLQLKAQMEGIPTPVYGLQKAHHLS